MLYLPETGPLYFTEAICSHWEWKMLVGYTINKIEEADIHNGQSECLNLEGEIRKKHKKLQK